MTTVNDILTAEEKQLIAEYEEGMNNAWTKRGVDRYYNKIQSIIEAANKSMKKARNKMKAHSVLHRALFNFIN